MNRVNPRVDAYLARTTKWLEETRELRRILLDCDLTEDLKWGKPCYTFENANIAIIQGFIQYCALMFFKGALMSDPMEILIQQTKNTQAARQLRFTNLQEIRELDAVVRSYIVQAVEVEKAGLKVDFKEKHELEYAEEFQRILDANPALAEAFEALTPGRQRAYNLYFSQPKQSKTRTSRVEKHIQRILDGKGLNDR